MSSTRPTSAARLFPSTKSSGTNSPCSGAIFCWHVRRWRSPASATSRSSSCSPRSLPTSSRASSCRWCLPRRTRRGRSTTLSRTCQRRSSRPRRSSHTRPRRQPFSAATPALRPSQRPRSSTERTSGSRSNSSTTTWTLRRPQRLSASRPRPTCSLDLPPRPCSLPRPSSPSSTT
eukprot:Amastigsp_a679749_60.p3 type:complete len:175 gc:universal Amastigsp_a679749_60:649-1173(+)